MVHISDGVLSLPVLIAGWAITLTIVGIILWKKKRKGGTAEEIPKLSVMTGAFFVASLIHIPLGPTSVHLLLNGLVGVILGVLAYPAIFIGIILQAVLFQHGGITTIGINTVIIGIPALIAYGVFRLGTGYVSRLRNESDMLPKRGVLESVFGGFSAALAVILAVLFLILCLVTTGKEFLGVASAVGIAHIPVIIIEAVITGSIVAFLGKVRPELFSKLGGERK